MDWEKCIRCQSSHVVPGGFAEAKGADTFVVDAGIAERPSFFLALHSVHLEELAWLCLDCGIAWQHCHGESLEELRTALREKALPEFRERLFGD